MKNIFKSIQQIPYNIPLSLSDEDNCCSGKMKRLKLAFENLGIPSKYRVCTFRWSEMELPKEVLDVPHEDNSTHVYLEVYIDGSWINIDPTWDPKLSNIFEIADWDGKNSTTIAVKPTHLLDYEESEKIMTE